MDHCAGAPVFVAGLAQKAAAATSLVEVADLLGAWNHFLAHGPSVDTFSTQFAAEQGSEQGHVVDIYHEQLCDHQHAQPLLLAQHTSKVHGPGTSALQGGLSFWDEAAQCRGGSGPQYGVQPQSGRTSYTDDAVCIADAHCSWHMQLAAQPWQLKFPQAQQLVSATATRLLPVNAAQLAAPAVLTTASYVEPLVIGLSQAMVQHTWDISSQPGVSGLLAAQQQVPQQTLLLQRHAGLLPQALRPPLQLVGSSSAVAQGAAAPLYVHGPSQPAMVAAAVAPTAAFAPQRQQQYVIEPAPAARACMPSAVHQPCVVGVNRAQCFAPGVVHTTLPQTLQAAPTVVCLPASAGADQLEGSIVSGGMPPIKKTRRGCRGGRQKRWYTAQQMAAVAALSRAPAGGYNEPSNAPPANV